MARPASNERKKQLLEAARDLIFAEGAGRFTIRRLASAVGITEAAVYRHYPGKEELLLALLESMFRRMRHIWGRLAGYGAPAPDRLLTLGRIHLRLLLDAKVNPLLLFSDAADPDQPRLRKALSAQLFGFADTVRSIVEQGCREGSLDRDLDQPAAIRCILGLLQHSVIRWTITGSTKGLRAGLDSSIRLLLAGFGAKGAAQLIPMTSLGSAKPGKA